MDSSLSSIFSRVADPRVSARCDHRLSDILFVALCTLLCDGEDFEDMAIFARQRLLWLKQVLGAHFTPPSHDTFNRVLQLIDPKSLSACLANDGQALLETIRGRQICLDGKRIKGVSPRCRGNQGYYILSAFVSEQRLCIGQSKVDAKSNEITAIPELLEAIDISGAVVSIDALGCQTAIAETIVKKGGDYLLSLKKNQERTFDVAAALFQAYSALLVYESMAKNHGRQESRVCSILPIARLDSMPEPLSLWTGLQTLVKIDATRLIRGKMQRKTRYYLSSAKGDNPCYYNDLARGHWAVENKLHWHLDVTFREDASRARSQNAPQNLSALRKLALHRIARMSEKLSLKKRRFKAALDPYYLPMILDF